ncbi:MAG: hypothetical protein KIT16_17000 [Rhodospirillaceae bacterium]|nr:hypothetical protein [Rhodospirillaceae bacterium]
MRVFARSAIVVAFAATLSPLVSAAEPPGSETRLAQSQPQRRCDNDRRACMAAGAQTGQFGVRFVPPDVVRQCNEAYRACIGRRN